MMSKLSLSGRDGRVRPGEVQDIDVGQQISPSASRSGESIKVLFRWKGSIYRLLWQPVLLYFSLYIFLTLIYEYALDETGQNHFQAVAQYCSRYTSSIPVILLLGFFTSTAMQRWFTTQTNVPGTARAITVFTLSLKEDTADGEVIVQQYARWLLLSWVLALRLICEPLKRQYPDLNSLQDAGLLLDHERIRLEEEELNGNGATLPLYVLDWILHLLKRINRQGCFNANNDFSRNVEVVLAFKKSCGNTIKFASKNIPFALIQAVAVTVYAFGVASLMSRQFVDRNQASIILTGYLPILHSIQYFLYFAWLKFGQMAANPFGEDDDDIDIKKLLINHVEDARRLRGLFGNPMEDLITQSLANCPPKLFEDEKMHHINESHSDDVPLNIFVQPTSSSNSHTNPMIDDTTQL